VTEPGRGEASLLGRGDGAVLGAVQPERAAAQQPADERDGERDAGDQAQALGQRQEEQRRGDGREQEPALLAPGDAATAEQRRQRAGEAEQPADERYGRGA
jgi:hypothetical protein